MSRDDFFSIMRILFSQKDLLMEEKKTNMAVVCPICGKTRKIFLDEEGAFSSVCENRSCAQI